MAYFEPQVLQIGNTEHKHKPNSIGKAMDVYWACM